MVKRLFVVAGQKYEPDWLVDDMRSNMSWADRVCIVDTRSRTKEYWIHEGQYRQLQRQELIRAGIKAGDWVLVTSPDERLEKNAEERIRDFIDRPQNGSAVGVLKLWEMFTPNEYRTDGIWGRKVRPRLYMFAKNQKFANRRIQTRPTPIGNYRNVVLPVNLYHLKMIEPENRIARAEAYKKTDPRYHYQSRNSGAFAKIDQEGKFKRLGYDYLSDIEGMVLETIPAGREYTPPYTKPYYFEPKDL